MQNIPGSRKETTRYYAAAFVAVGSRSTREVEPCHKCKVVNFYVVHCKPLNHQTQIHVLIRRNGLLNMCQRKCDSCAAATSVTIVL